MNRCTKRSTIRRLDLLAGGPVTEWANKPLLKIEGGWWHVLGFDKETTVLSFSWNSGEKAYYSDNGVRLGRGWKEVTDAAFLMAAKRQAA